jgi:multidrug efflux pump subunit AcrA (membrane-fusion protein)
VKWKTVGECTLLPSRRAAVVSEIAGTVQRVFVKEGDAVEPGTALAQLDTRRLETELEAAVQEKFRHLAEADRFRAPPLSDEASAQVAQAQAAIAGETEKRIRADIASASLRSPIAGVVLTKSPELRAGEYLQPGSLFAEIGGIDRWELHADVDERDIGLVERFLADKGSLPLPFILYAETAQRLEATLSDRQQISAAAQPREKKNVFVVTVKDPPIPGELLRVMRPGLTGKAKVELAVRPLSFVVAHNIASWFRLRWINL